jgi:hypothetical protein
MPGRDHLQPVCYLIASLAQLIEEEKPLPISIVDYGCIFSDGLA